MTNLKTFLFSIVIVSSLFSCSVSKNLKFDCSQMNDSNYYVFEAVRNRSPYTASEMEITNLKAKLVSDNIYSVKVNNKTLGGIVNNVSKGSFSSEKTIVSYGFITNPNVSYCKRGKDILVVLSINKEKFMEQSIVQYQNELKINLITINSALTNYDPSKRSFNKTKAKLFSTKVQEIQSLHSFVVNPVNFSKTKIQEYNNSIASLTSVANEFSKLSYVFDDELKDITNLIDDEQYKAAYSSLLQLIRAYGPSTNEGVTLSALKNQTLKEINRKWKAKTKEFYKQLSSESTRNAALLLGDLKKMTINQFYINNYDLNLEQYFKVFRKVEKRRLLALSMKNQEIYFGLNATTGYGNIVSSDNSVSLDTETTNFKLDRVFPSYKIGYKYYFNIQKRIGLFLQFKSNSSKFIELSSSPNSDYEFPFSANFNEIQVGLSAGAFDFSFGKILNSMSVDNQDIEFKTASINLSLITTDGSIKGKKNYFNLYGGVNVISDFKDKSYISFVVGLNYHIRFNKKLNKKDKKYLSTI